MSKHTIEVFQRPPYTTGVGEVQIRCTGAEHGPVAVAWRQASPLRGSSGAAALSLLRLVSGGGGTCGRHMRDMSMSARLTDI